jgi:hypothetical protein
MDGNKYAKIFKKTLCQETIINDNGYPTNRRRDTGVTKRITKWTTKYEWVPYNPWLSLKYDSHINLECCASIVNFHLQVRS